MFILDVSSCVNAVLVTCRRDALATECNGHGHPTDRESFLKLAKRYIEAFDSGSRLMAAG